MAFDGPSSNRLFFRPEDFPGGEILWNSMEYDFDVIEEEFYRDLLLVSYPNACSLFLTWYEAREGHAAHFGVSLVQNSEKEYEPFAEFSCESLAELRTFVHSCATIAASRPSIPRPLSSEWRLYSPFHEPPVDRLMLDPLEPLSEQTQRLHAQLFVGYIPKGRVLVIGWEPAHQFPGEFVIRRYHDDGDRWDLNENDPPGLYPRTSWQLIDEWRCDSTAAIRNIVESVYDQP